MAIFSRSWGLSHIFCRTIPLRHRGRAAGRPWGPAIPRLQARGRAAKNYRSYRKLRILQKKTDHNAGKLAI
jgi:hypothetical protein